MEGSNQTRIAKKGNVRFKHYKLANMVEYPKGTLYEYDNGMKVFYEPTEASSSMEIAFYGGSRVQGNQAGLAHLTEHSFFHDADVKTRYASYSQSIYNSPIYDGHTNSRVVGFKSQTTNHKNDISKISKESVIKESKRTIVEFVKFIDELFYQINKTDIDTDWLENEKHVIDTEYAKKITAPHTILWSMQNTDPYTNCGNISSLRGVKPNHIIKYKKQNMTLENMLVIVKSPFDYKMLEPIIIQEVGKRVISKPYRRNETPAEQIRTQSKYEIYPRTWQNLYDLDNAVGLDVKISVNKKDFAHAEDMLTALHLLTGLTNNFNLRQVLRYKQGISYSLAQYFDSSANQVTITTREAIKKENVSEYLKSIMTYFSLLSHPNEAIYEVLNRIQSRPIKLNCENRENCKDCTNLNQMVPSKLIAYTKKQLKNLNVEQACDLVARFVKSAKFNIALTGDVDLKQLPTTQYLQDLLQGNAKSPLEYADKNLADEYKNTPSVVAFYTPLREEKSREQTALTVVQDKECMEK